MSELIRLHWHGANGGPGLALDAVRQTVTAIRDIAGDPEAAHAAEDNLWGEVLAAIAHEDLDPDYARQLAAEAIRTADINFPRWYA